MPNDPPPPPQWQHCCSTRRSLGQVQAMCWGPCVWCCCWARCTARSCQQNPAGGVLAVPLPAQAPAPRAGRGAFRIVRHLPPVFRPFRLAPCAGVTITTLVSEDSRRRLSFTLHRPRKSRALKKPEENSSRNRNPEQKGGSRQLHSNKVRVESFMSITE